MSNLYPSPTGHTIPEWNATITGGITLVLYTPVEVEGLKVLCSLAGQPPENRWQAIIDLLKRTGPSLNLEDWRQYRDRVAPRWPEVPEEEENEVVTLIALLDYVRTLWENENQLPGPNTLALAVTLADPSHVSYPEITVSVQRPALAFHPGSRLETTLLGSRIMGIMGGTVKRFIVNLFVERNPDTEIEAAFQAEREAPRSGQRLHPSNR